MLKDWVRKATTNQETIRGWFAKNPDANIGVSTGRTSNLLVIDVDPRNGGDKSFESVSLDLGELPATTTALTGGRGRHLFFRYPSKEIKTSKSKMLGKGVDVLSDGAFVIMARSLHQSGRLYRWKSKLGSRRMKPAELPDAWVSRLSAFTPPPTAAPTCVSLPTPTEIIPEGKRNDSLARYAGTLHRTGIDADAILAALITQNMKLCRPPLEEEEVRRIVGSITRYPTPAAINSTCDPAEQLMHATLSQHFQGGDHIRTPTA